MMTFLKRFNWISFASMVALIVIGAMYGVCMAFAVAHSRQRALEVAANRDEDDEF